MNTLSTLVGSNYEISFIKYGINYKVIVQASPEYRALPEDILKLYVKNDRDEMVPYSAFIRKVYGLSEITRHNMYTSTEISGSAAVDIVVAAIKVIQVAAEKLPRGYDIDWAGISADEVSQGIKPFGYFLSVWVLCIWF
jgi:HAE1 family hydrophobic/amphiphilic exporter-1